MYTYNTALFFIIYFFLFLFFFSFVLNNLVTMHLWYKSFIINTQNIRISRIIFFFFSSICRTTFGNKYSS